MTQRTYTYTAADYREVFGRANHGVVGVNPNGDLIWARRSDIVWAKETVVLNAVNLAQYRPDEIVYSPSALQKDDFDARQ